MISILGAGPAGSSAAIAALRNGSSVQLIERSALPRHKVCGEFLSPEIVEALASLGILGEFLKLGPARIHRMVVNVGGREKVSRLPEAAYGLSRYAFDYLLLRSAQELGAAVTTGSGDAQIIATGRKSPGGRRGERLFGFKAHYEGPVDNAVELYFFDRCYVGINCIEALRTNVCGLAPESVLRAHGFDIDSLLAQSTAALTARIAPLTRSMKWLFVGPLEFRSGLTGDSPGRYVAGDAASFVDPFTGSGLLSAVATGALAGKYAALAKPVAEYEAACRRALLRPFGISSALRWLSTTRWADRLLESVPGSLLFYATRPRFRFSAWKPGWTPEHPGETSPTPPVGSD